MWKRAAFCCAVLMIIGSFTSGCCNKYRSKFLECNRKIMNETTLASTLITDCRQGDNEKCEDLRKAIERINLESKQVSDILVAEDLIMLEPEN